MVLLPKLHLGTLIMFILSTPVQFWVGAPFYRAAWNGLKHGSMGMDFLIMTGTTLAYGYSLGAVIAEASGMNAGMSFFEMPAMLLGFVVVGKYLETRAKGSVSEALTKLVGLQAASATLLEPVEGESPASLCCFMGRACCGACRSDGAVTHVLLLLLLVDLRHVSSRTRGQGWTCVHNTRHPRPPCAAG